MTSEGQLRRCFVYVTLPGEVQPVVAGRFELSRDGRGDPLGRFVYAKTYLGRQEAVPLCPVDLPLVARRFETVRLGGVFGALRDAGPDD